MAPTQPRRSERKRTSLRKSLNEETLLEDMMVPDNDQTIVAASAEPSITPRPKTKTKLLLARPAGVASPKVVKKAKGKKRATSRAPRRPRVLKTASGALTRSRVRKNEEAGVVHQIRTNEESVKPTKNSPLMDLSRELRERIYHFALLTDKPIRNGGWIDGIGRFHPRTTSSSQRQVQLLRINKKIHDEASWVLYHFGRFEFREVFDLGLFLKALHKTYRSMLGNVAIDFDVHFWNSQHSTIFEHLSKCHELKKLELRITSNKVFEYLLSGDRSLDQDLENFPVLKELLLCHGINDLKIRVKCYDEPELRKIKAKLLKLLKTQLVKPRKSFEKQFNPTKSFMKLINARK